MGGRSDARAVLPPIHGGYSEGFETTDISEGKRLLAGLSRSMLNLALSCRVERRAVSSHLAARVRAFRVLWRAHLSHERGGKEGPKYRLALPASNGCQRGDAPMTSDNPR